MEVPREDLRGLHKADGEQNERHLGVTTGTAASASPSACARAALRRGQRRASALAARAKLAEKTVNLQCVTEQRDAFLHGADAGRDHREAAVLAALRLHQAACHRIGHDTHFAAAAVQRAGWLYAESRESLRRGNVGRHCGLHSMADAEFADLHGARLGRLQRNRARPAVNRVWPDWLRCDIALAQMAAEQRAADEDSDVDSWRGFCPDDRLLHGSDFGIDCGSDDGSGRRSP